MSETIVLPNTDEHESAAAERFTPQWGPDAPRGARAVLARIIKEGANVPLFLGQTLVNALRDLGYNDTTSAICEHVDNAVQWGAQEIRVYFNETGKRGGKNIDVLVLDNGVGMAPNVLRAATAFGGSMCYDNRAGIGRYGMGMKGAALSMAPTLDIYSWQALGAIYSMTLDIEDIGSDRANVVNLPEPELIAELPPEVQQILTTPMVYPKNPDESQELLATSLDALRERVGLSGTIVFMPNCDRLTYRTAKHLVDHAIKEMSRIYRRQLGRGLRLFVNNKPVEPFDPTYSMESARHTRVEGLNQKHGTLVRKWELQVPHGEDSPSSTSTVAVRMYVLPMEDWLRLSRKTLKNDLHVFEGYDISFMRSDREVQIGTMASIAGKHRTIDAWWRIEIEFPADLDEAFGVAVNKQGVRPKSYVTDAIRAAIQEELRTVRNRITKLQAARSSSDSGAKISEAERRANDAEAFLASVVPQPKPESDAERLALEQNLRTLAITVKRSGESDEEAFQRVRSSRFVTTFKHDPDAAFYRVDTIQGKIILAINSAHPFFERIFRPLSDLANSTPPTEMSPETDEDESSIADTRIRTVCSEAVIGLQLMLLSLARTQSAMVVNETETGRIFDTLRRQWSLNLEAQLTTK